MPPETQTIKASDTLQAMFKESFATGYDLAIDHAMGIVQDKCGLYPGLCDKIISQLKELKNKEA